MRQEREGAPEIQKILVALDASSHSQAALQAAVELAQRFEAELEGIFVEDVSLLRLAQLPFAKEVGHYSAIRRRIDVTHVERQLRVQSFHIRRTFTVFTETWGVRGDFRVARGAVSRELLAAAAEADVVVLGRRGAALPLVHRLGSTARSMLTRASVSTLILQDGMRVGAPILLVYDGSPVADRALQVTTQLLDEEKKLTVLLVAEDPDQVERLQAQLAEALPSDMDLELRYRRLSASAVPRLAQRIQLEERGTLVLPVHRTLLREEALQRLIDQVDVPVLLVR